MLVSTVLHNHHLLIIKENNIRENKEIKEILKVLRAKKVNRTTHTMNQILEH